MKKNLMLFAAAAAAFGLLTVTGCEDNAGNEENNGEETTDISINKLWCAEVGEGETAVKYCFNITETEYEIGRMSADLESSLLYFDNADADNSYISNGKFEISDRTDEETSGSITYTAGETSVTISYSSLTENSVTITIPGATTEDEEVVYECTAVADAVFYTQEDIATAQNTAVALPAGLQKQWIVTAYDESMGGDVDWLFDCTTSEGKLIRQAMMNEMYAAMLPDMGFPDFNADTDFYPMDDITPNKISENGTSSGTIIATSAMSSSIIVIEYSNLTETSVSLTFDGVKYDCTATTGKNILDLGM